jgi:Domain of unknown function (DUF202)
MTGPAAAEPEETDTGLARERTSLSWTRTAISFAALGGVMLKENVITGLIILAVTPLIWRLGRLAIGGSPPGQLPVAGRGRILLITVSIVAVSLLCLFVAVLGPAVPGALRR